MRQPFRMRTREGIHFWVRTKEDLGIAFEIFIGEIYTSHLSILPGDVVVDIGGHEGIFSFLAASRGATVYTYEPDPYNFQWLQKNKMLNPHITIHEEQVACFEKSGEKMLFLRNKSSRGGNSFFQYDGHVDSISVQCVTLEQIIQKHNISKIHFLKIDCEGSEFPILHTLSNAVWNKIEKIGLEIHSGPSFQNGTVDEILDLLKAHGFSIRARIFLSNEFSIVQASRN